MIYSRLALPFIPTGIRYFTKGKRIGVEVKFGRPVYKDSAGKLGSFFQKVMAEIAHLSGLP